MRGAGKKATTIDEYLAGVPSDRRATLTRLRRTIRAAAPGVEECISYGMPAFRLEGRVIAGFAATAGGGSYYPFSGTTLGTLAAELEGWSRTRSAVHFTVARPLPAALVRRLLAARIAEAATVTARRRDAVVRAAGAPAPSRPARRR